MLPLIGIAFPGILSGLFLITKKTGVMNVVKIGVVGKALSSGYRSGEGPCTRRYKDNRHGILISEEGEDALGQYVATLIKSNKKLSKYIGKRMYLTNNEAEQLRGITASMRPVEMELMKLMKLGQTGGLSREEMTYIDGLMRIRNEMYEALCAPIQLFLEGLGRRVR